MPEDRTFTESNLCSLGPRPQVMTALFLTELRRHYSSADNLEYAVFRERLYTETATTEDSTGIMIEDASVWTPTRTQKRPAILVKRNAWKHLKRLTMANQGIERASKNTQHVKLWRGSHTLFCIAPNGGECELLTAETYRYLMHFGHLFRKYFRLLMFELLDVGPLSMVKEASTHYAVPITIVYGRDESWFIRKHAPPLTDERLQAIFDEHINAQAGKGARG